MQNTIQNTVQRINISHVTNEHSSWLRGLNFYKTELVILKGILTEVAGKNTDREMMKEVEHFENQFKAQAENIDQLAHDIHINIDAIGRQAKLQSAGYIDGNLLSQHDLLLHKYESLEAVLKDVVKAFRRFAAQWM